MDFLADDSQEISSLIFHENQEVHLINKFDFLSVYDLVNRHNSNLLLIFIFYIVCQVSIFI